MRGYFLPGLFLAVATGVLVWGGEWLGLELQHVALLGAALGGATGVVPDRAPWERAAGLLSGAVLAWIGYALRAAWLPDTSAGRGVAAMLVVLACLLIAFLTSGRLPLWSFLMGAAAVVGAYEVAYTAAPPEFVETSPTALTTVLLAAAFGFLATVFLGNSIEDERERERGRYAPDDDPESGDRGGDNTGDGRGVADTDAESGRRSPFWEGALR
ncbi:hypothetical protein E1212_28695 [Jiangella ureilytica]|uniref:Uncharacterized protein n=1 Tax=Jiangella ureilytica TaxID=2530374 RepID=A0A4R4RA92_9ACTN|nr:hypothetical protein [Jiangella ureilytica]TDC45569.1 hypothetical protein E1212_28695 [Jiangella ureilytica]